MSTDAIKRWVRLPGGGELRGEGRWTEINASQLDSWEQTRDTSWLPTAWEVPEHVDVFEKDRLDVRPRFVVAGNILVDQKYRIAANVPNPCDDKALRWAHAQLNALADQGDPE